MKLLLKISRVVVDDSAELRIGIENTEPLDENREIIVAVFSDSSALPLMHIHLRSSVSSTSIRIPCTPMLRIEVYLCRVVARRPPLRSEIVVHRDPSRPRLLLVEYDGKKFIAELLPGGGIHLHSSGPVLKKRGSLLLVEKVLMLRSYRILCVDRSRPLGRLLMALKKLFSWRELR